MAKTEKAAPGGAQRATKEEAPETPSAPSAPTPASDTKEEALEASSAASPPPTEADTKKAPPPIDGAKTSGEGGPPAPAPKAPRKAQFPYEVAEGRAITSSRGILAEGQEVKADYLHAGQAALDRLVAAGVVVHTPSLTAK